MLKRLSMMLCAIVIIFIGCSPSTKIANADAGIKSIIRPGTSLVECKALERGLAVKIVRHQNSLCAKEVWMHQDLFCTDSGTEVNETKSSKKIKPNKAFSGSGNQFCPEAFAEFVNSPACFQYTTGGRTYYIPPGPNCPP